MYVSDDDVSKSAPQDTFLGAAYHSNITHRKEGDEDDEPMPITELSDVVANEL